MFRTFAEGMGLAKKTIVDGIQFDSKREAKRYGELKLKQQVGQIKGLKVHTVYHLVVNNIKIGKYTDDFCYYDESNKWVVEDCKVRKSRDYPLRKKLMLALYGIRIVET